MEYIKTKIYTPNNIPVSLKYYPNKLEPKTNKKLLKNSTHLGRGEKIRRGRNMPILQDILHGAQRRSHVDSHKLCGKQSNERGHVVNPDADVAQLKKKNRNKSTSHKKFCEIRWKSKKGVSYL